jgi:RNA methyltransferase, TrmH family
MLITSSSNPTIKLVKKLRERKTREETGLFYIEGLRIVGAARENVADFECVITCPQLLSSEYGQKMLALLLAKRARHIEVSKEIFSSISLKEGPQGIAALVKQSWTPLDQVNLSDGEITIALDEVADPGNLGTIMRTLDSVGGKGIILMDHTTDPYDPSSMRASMGSIFSIGLTRCSFDQFHEWKKRFHYHVVGTSGSAKAKYYQYAYPFPLILLMGSERLGLQDRHYALCDEVVSIPMAGKNDSLNLAMATGIILAEIYNQRAGRPVWVEGEREVR